MSIAALSGDTDSLKRALMLGLDRHPLTSKDPLAELSLMAARERFGPPQFHSGNADAPVGLAPAGAYLAEDSRALLVRLLTGSSTAASDAIALAALGAVRRSGLRVHPFDFARIEDSLVSDHANLTSPEKTWLKLVRPLQLDQEDASDALDEASLASAGKRQKLEYLAQLRGSEPGRARDLIAALFPTEPANLRVEMVSLLAHKLSDRDLPFLETLQGDRSQQVRDAGSALLATLPGTDAFAKRKIRLVDDLKIKTEGLLRRRKVLIYAGPPETKPGSSHDAQRILLQGLRVADIAAALGETPEALLEIASRSDRAGIVPPLLLLQGVADGNFEMVSQYCSALDGHEWLVLDRLVELLHGLEGASRQQVLALLLRPAAWPAAAIPAITGQLSQIMSAPLPETTALDLLSLPDTSEMLLSAMAPLIPRTCSTRFIARAEAMAPRAALYHCFILSLLEP